MAQGEDLCILVAVAGRQQTKHRERVSHSQVAQSQQHDRTSFRAIDTHARGQDRVIAVEVRTTHSPLPIRTDGVFGKRKASRSSTVGHHDA
ncbi:hypothetical protein [Streptomyces malaysiensis]|uniref:Uncharacterized protein n=1 Tax=Streptomyces malaysiensis subsp. samsunensis TaxID=459658 RepID=A0A9X2M6H9_STRMQ|nr:hypothetical protein [Streptomyces samsunensis]MCQ8836342.1 hypothetical protein [Streptomyces samsunensis]